MLVQRPWVRLLCNHSGTHSSPKPLVIPSGRRLWATVCSSSTAAEGAPEGGGAPKKRTGRSRAKDSKNSGHGQLTKAAAVPTSGKADATSDAAAEAGIPASLSQILPVPARGQPDFPDAPFRLRPYQVEAIQSVVLKWKEEGANAQMVMLPTGCGKTVVFAALARYMSQHYVPPTTADTAGSSTDTASTSVLLPEADSQLSQPRSGPTVAAVSTGEYSPAEESEWASGVGASSSSSSSPATDEGETWGSESVSDDGGKFEFAPISASRFRQAKQGVQTKPRNKKGSPAPTQRSGQSSRSTAASTLQELSTEASEGGVSTRSTSSSERSNNAKANTVDSSSSSPGSSSVMSSSEDSTVRKSPSGKGRKPRQQQPQQPQVQAPAGSMRVLVLAHRHELLHQAEEKFRLMWGAQDLTVSWVKGKRKEFGGQVVVASVATAVNCIPSLCDCNFSLVVVDEAHHTVASTYKTILQGLGLIEEVLAEPAQDADVQEQASAQPTTGAWRASSSDDSMSGSLDSFDEAEGYGSIAGSRSSSRSAEGSQDEDKPPKMVVRAIPNPNQLLLGFSATPYRLKRRESEDLYSMFQLAYGRSISDMIRERYLCEITSQKILTQTDLKGAGTGTSGDFILSKLSLLVNSRTRNRLVLAAYLEHCTEPVAKGTVRYSAEQLQEHNERAQLRKAHVVAALQAKARRDAAKEQQKAQALLEMMGGAGTAVMVSAPSTDGDSDEASFELQDSEEEEDEEEPADEMWPLPPDVKPAQLTAGLRMAGRKARRKTIAFAVDIKHAEAMNAMFNAAGVRASVIHSMMPHEVMREELARFRAGDLEVLFNVEVLTEGFDEPSIDAILMARPTRSPGLYTQMLGRGLRIMPGKRDCMVLDFTDKYHQAGKVMDLRVLLEELPYFGDEGEDHKKKGPTRIDENATGGEVDMLERGLDPKDLAWRNMGPHCMASIFSSGIVWLVNVGRMGPSQRSKLGLMPPAQRKRKPAAQAAPADSDAGDEDSDDDDAAEDRYVVLHQSSSKETDPMTWRVAYATGHTWRGFSKEDAYGAALAYIDTHVRAQQAHAVQEVVRARRTGRKPRSTFYHLNTFKQDAPWRSQPASDRQLQMLKQLEISVSKSLTKGEASDLISEHKCSLAEPTQLQELQALQGVDVSDLPVPLLKAHADNLLELPSDAAS